MNGRIEFKPEKVILTPIESKKEESAAPVRTERHTFKLETYVIDDKYDAMKAISKVDPTAEFRVTGDWSLRVRTALTYNEMMQIMIYTKSFNRLKKAWFF